MRRGNVSASQPVFFCSTDAESLCSPRFNFMYRVSINFAPRIGAAVSLLIMCGAALAGEIHDAAADGDLVKVRALIEKDPSLVNLKDASGGTPLHEAARKGHVTVVEFLLANKADVNARDATGASVHRS